MRKLYSVSVIIFPEFGMHGSIGSVGKSGRRIQQEADLFDSVYRMLREGGSSDDIWTTALR